MIALGICICICLTAVIIALIAAACYYMEHVDEGTFAEKMEILERLDRLEKELKRRDS